MGFKAEANRLSTERLFRAQNRLAENPYDIESWNIIIRDAKAKSIEETRTIYESFVSQFPNQGKFWKTYIEAEIKAKNYEKVEKLFQRCLIKILSIELWLCYLNYIKKVKADQPNFKERLAQAYEFTLDKVGLDLKAASVWTGQIEFLKNIDAVGSYAENQKIAAIRKVYHRACITPMLNLEQIWRDYVAFEQGINPLIAKKMTDELSKEYMSARRTLKELEATTRGLDRNTPPTPLTGSAYEIKQIETWKRYINFEKLNPLNYDDKNLIIKRVSYAYEQSLLSMSFYSEFWVEFGLYLQKASKELLITGDNTASKALLDKTSEIYERANTTFFKTNVFMHFVQADFEESRQNYSKADAVYTNLLEPSIPADINNDITLVYIQYMRFSRRVHGIKGARTVFKRARDDERTKYHIYTCSAYMEYYSSKEKTIALKIFELGLKRFASDIEYLKAYIDFSLSLNDDNNTRVLFERLLSLSQNILSSENLAELWNRFLQFEIEVGDLNNILKVDQRRIMALQKDTSQPQTMFLIDRYKFHNLLPCSTLECRMIGYNLPTTNAPVKTNSLNTDDLTNLFAILLQKDPNLNVDEIAKAFAASQSASGLQSSNSKDGIGSAKSRQTTFPDLTQMLPFKPQKSTPYGNQHVVVPGGNFAFPPSVEALLPQLPSLSSYKGPFVMLDTFLSLLSNVSIDNANKTNVVIQQQLKSSASFGHLSNNIDNMTNNTLLQSPNTSHQSSVIRQNAKTSPNVCTNSNISPNQIFTNTSPHSFDVNQTNSTTGLAKYKSPAAQFPTTPLYNDEGSSTPPITDIYRMRQQNKIK